MTIKIQTQAILLKSMDHETIQLSKKVLKCQLSSCRTSVSDYLFAGPSAAIDVRFSISIFAWYYPLSECKAPIVNYQGPVSNTYGVHLWSTMNMALQVR